MTHTTTYILRKLRKIPVASESSYRGFGHGAPDNRQLNTFFNFDMPLSPIGSKIFLSSEIDK